MSDPQQPAPERSLDWDDGVASERTSLSWERTALSSMVLAALVLRAGIASGPLAIAIPVAALVIGAALAEWWFSRRVYHHHDRPYALGAVLHDREMASLAAVTVIAAAGAAWLAVSG